MASMCVVKKGDVERHGFLDSKQELSDLFTGDSDDFQMISRLFLRAVRALLCLCSVWGALPCSLLRLFSRCAGRRRHPAEKTVHDNKRESTPVIPYLE